MAWGPTWEHVEVATVQSVRLRIGLLHHSSSNTAFKLWTVRPLVDAAGFTHLQSSRQATGRCTLARSQALHQQGARLEGGRKTRKGQLKLMNCWTRPDLEPTRA